MSYLKNKYKNKFHNKSTGQCRGLGRYAIAGFTIAVTMATTATMTATAQPHNSLHSSIQLLPTPPDQGAPSGRQRGGATRGDCLDYQNLTALVPEVEGVVWSRTASDTPSFFFDVPAPLTPATPLEFIIQDSEDNYIVRQELAIEATAGIVEIAVPTDTAAPTNKAELMPGENYRWTLAIYCDAARPSASVSVTGTLNRVAGSQATLSADIAQDGTLSENISLIQQYAGAGLWHESIRLAFDLYQSAPDNAAYVEPLEALLADAGLVDVPVTVPVLVSRNR